MVPHWTDFLHLHPACCIELTAKLSDGNSMRNFLCISTMFLELFCLCLWHMDAQQWPCALCTLYTGIRACLWVCFWYPLFPSLLSQPTHVYRVYTLRLTLGQCKNHKQKHTAQEHDCSPHMTMGRQSQVTAKQQSRSSYKRRKHSQERRNEQTPVEESGDVSFVRVSNPAHCGWCALRPGQEGIDVDGGHIIPGSNDAHVQQVRPSLHTPTTHHLHVSAAQHVPVDIIHHMCSAKGWKSHYLFP